MRTATHGIPLPRTAGFSLLELMVVVVILSVLSLAIVPRVIDRPDQARKARATSDIAVLTNAVALYSLDNQSVPTTEQGLLALIEQPTVAPFAPNWTRYIDRLPKDPWGNDYLYLAPGIHGDFDIFSFGADGIRGGDGKDADIGNWQSN